MTEHDPARPARLPLMLLLAVLAGTCMPAQARLNATLTQATGRPVVAALTSFTAGLVVILLLTALLPQGRRAWGRVGPALRSGTVRWWMLLAGAWGGVFVLSQTFTVPVLGVAVFTVAVVTGQVMGGMAVDRFGLGPAGRQTITPRRLLGAVLALAAVLVVVWPALTGAGTGVGGGAVGVGAVGVDSDGAGADGPGGAGWAGGLLVLVPLLAGLGTSIQQLLNGRQTTAYGSPLPATLINFAAGVALLAVGVGVSLLVTGPPPAMPSTWWLYLGGPLGCVFIGLTAVLVPRIGSFLTILGLVAGQLVGSLLIDLVVPAPGAGVTTMTVLGTLGALAAVVLGSSGGVPRGLRRRRRWWRPRARG